MKWNGVGLLALTLMAGLIAVSVPVCTAAPVVSINAMIGDRIPLNGTALLVDTVYLSMTGPQVPVNGARMDNSNAPVITGNPDSFTQVGVENDKWQFVWNTGRVTGGLAPGLYTVYVSTTPVAAGDTAGAKYDTISIRLSHAVTTGELTIISQPPGAHVSLNGKYLGDTPLTLPSVAASTYLVAIQGDGYVPVNQTVDIMAGQRVTLTPVLVPLQIPVTTSLAVPPPATSPPATVANPPATTAAASVPLAGIVLGLIGAGLALRKKE